MGAPPSVAVHGGAGAGGAGAGAEVGAGAGEGEEEEEKEEEEQDGCEDGETLELNAYWTERFAKTVARMKKAEKQRQKQRGGES